jgi:hypothetical protein
MTPEALADTLADLGAAAVLCQHARAALEASNPQSAYDFARTARTVLSWAFESLAKSLPPVDNSPPIGG